MRATITGLPAVLLALSACTPLTQNEPGGALFGAAGGFIAAQVLEFDNDWVLATTLAGAAAGALVARNSDLQQCAYATGDGTYYTAACP